MVSQNLDLVTSIDSLHYRTVFVDAAGLADLPAEATDAVRGHCAARREYDRATEPGQHRRTAD